MNIIIVEDEVKPRIGLVNLIQKINPDYKVVGEADNGYDGMKLIEELRPDLVIADIKMPKISGLKMIRDLKEKGICPKVIILSGYAEFEYAKEGIDLGVSSYLLKPIMVDDLKQTLEIIAKQIKSEQESDHRQFIDDCKIDSSRYSFIVNKVLQLIEKEYGQRIVLEEVAEQFRITPEYLSSLFRKETGKQFSHYLKEYRVMKAKELLLKSDLKIYEVAYKVGYTDPKYFCRVFKEITGLPAGEYVKMYVK
ncbi:MAG: two-component system, response regulator YesN [Epulopiscium sp.]|jgi:two-component system response regulator YesN|nr:two-component system, response regulator YesN [Candidatus Epulonipiscium sp.]